MIELQDFEATPHLMDYVGFLVHVELDIYIDILNLALNQVSFLV